MSPHTNGTVVITGAASGLGRALAFEFYQRGYHLALIDVDQQALNELKFSRPHARQKVTIHHADIFIEDQIVSVVAAVINTHFRVDILINNAGISISQPFVEMQLANFRHLMDVNFWGMVYCTRHFLPFLLASPQPRLVNVISGFALMGFPGKTAYASSKAAIMAFTNALKTELADYKIKLSLVIPPPLDTAIVRSGIHVSEEKRNAEAAFLAKEGMPLDKAARLIVKRISTGRYRIVIGTKTRILDVLARFFPAALLTAIAKKRKVIDFV